VSRRFPTDKTLLLGLDEVDLFKIKGAEVCFAQAVDFLWVIAQPAKAKG
jgi:hypothetical protein